MPDLDPTQYRLSDLKLRWQQDPSSRLFLQLADEHRKLGQHQEAVTVLEQGLNHRPNDLSALVALGRCRLELERVDEAIEPLEAVVSRDPTHIVASKLLIEAHLQRGNGEKAAERLRTYRLLNDRDPELHHLEYRLQRLLAEDEQEASTVAGGELPGEPAEEAETTDAEAAVAARSDPAVEDAVVEAVPEVWELEAAEPGANELEAAELGASVPGAEELEAGELEAVEPEVSEPEAAELEVIEPAAAEPGAIEFEAEEPEAMELEAAEPEAIELEAAEPEAAEPEAVEPEAAAPEAAAPEAAAPEAAEPEAAELEMVEFEAPEPEVAEPATVEPESVDPEPVLAARVADVDLFHLSGDVAPSLDFGALWEQLPEPKPAPAAPFLGLVALDAGRHWELLSEEGIFAFPRAPAGNGGSAAVALAEVPPAETETVVEPEAVAEPEAIEPEVVEPETAEPEAVAEPETAAPEAVAEPETAKPEAVAEPEAIEPESVAEPEAIEPEAVAEPEAIAEPAGIFAEPTVDYEDLVAAPEAGAPMEEPAESMPSAGAVVAGIAAAGLAAAAGLSGVRESGVEVEPPSEPADQAPAALEAAPEPAEEPVVEADSELPAAYQPEISAAEPAIRAEEPAAEEPATATLGELYLKQGYPQEAEKIFRQVLEQDPGNRVALENLARLEPQPSIEPTEPPPRKSLSSADLLAVRTASGRIPEGLTAKKVLVLSNYSKHLRAAARRRRAGGALSASPGTGANGMSPGTGANGI